MLFSPVYTEAHPRRIADFASPMNLRDAAHAAHSPAPVFSNPFRSYPFRTLASHLKATVSPNPFEFKRFRTLCKMPGIGYLWFLKTLFPHLVVEGDWHILADRTGSRGTRGKSRILMGLQRMGVRPGLPARDRSEGKRILIGNNVLKVHRYPLSFTQSDLREGLPSRLFPTIHPISLQPLTICSSRNSFALITIHFHGGCTPPAKGGD
jgi:hypothetical protein